MPRHNVSFKDIRYTELKHEISAFYSGGAGEPYYRPVLECSCGFSTGRQDTWEDAGREFDEHRKKIKETLK